MSGESDTSSHSGLVAQAALLCSYLLPLLWRIHGSSTRKAHRYTDLTAEISTLGFVLGCNEPIEYLSCTKGSHLNDIVPPCLLVLEHSTLDGLTSIKMAGKYLGNG